MKINDLLKENSKYSFKNNKTPSKLSNYDLKNSRQLGNSMIYKNNLRSSSINKLKYLKDKIDNKFRKNSKCNSQRMKNNSKDKINKNPLTKTTHNWMNMKNSLLDSKRPKTCYNKSENINKNILELKNIMMNNRIVNKESIFGDSEINSQNMFFKKSNPIIINENYHFVKNNRKNLNFKKKKNVENYEKNFEKIKEKAYKKLNNSYEKSPYDKVLENINLLNKNEIFKIKSILDNKLESKFNNNEITIADKIADFSFNNVNEIEQDYEETDQSMIEIKNKINEIENMDLKFY